MSDYAVRCTGNSPVTVTVSSPGANPAVFVVNGTTVTGNGSVPVSLQASEEFTVEVEQAGTAQYYYVRCLPPGFPAWTSLTEGAPQAQYYLVAPTFGGSASDRYVAIFDTHGVPVWWAATPSPYMPVDAKLVTNPASGAPNVLLTESASPDATLGYTAEQIGLDGSVVDASISPSSGYQSNAHEVQLLSDGDYLVAGSYSLPGYNLSSHGGPASASIRDDVVQEVKPSGSVVWTWDAAQYVQLSQVNSQWWSTIIGGGSPYDVFHLNSAVTDASGNLLVSLRYTNAVFYVDNPRTSSGTVLWKLGGSYVPDESLAVENDPVFSSGGGFGGQHYARFFSDGDRNVYVTLHDNGTGQGRAPRGAEYKIDGSAMTATLTQQVTDVSAPGLRSNCCGSAQLLPGGDWVVSWGGDPVVAELTPSGARVFAITFSGVFSYRAFPVLSGVLDIGTLRSDMDAQYPLPG